MSTTSYSENHSLKSIKAEIWLPVKNGEPFYMISNLGRVKCLKRTHDTGRRTLFPERIIKQLISERGYLYFKINKNGRQSTAYVHKKMAESFLSNPDNKPTVNHIDGNKLNNIISNLEWATYSENNKHAFDIGLRVGANKGRFGKESFNRKAVIQKSLTNEFIKEWDCMKDAQLGLGLGSYSGIGNCCRGLNKTAHGYKWEYLKIEQ